MKDLNLTLSEKQVIKKSYDRSEVNPRLVSLIKSRYALKSPATFGQAPKDRSVGYPNYKGDEKRGKKLFIQSCLHCHKEDGPSYYTFYKDNETTTRLFENRIRIDKKSFYQSTREGIFFDYPDAYMPLFPLERLSNRQIEDLKEFFKTGFSR